jgi:hypothetical protein
MVLQVAIKCLPISEDPLVDKAIPVTGREGP